MLLIMVIAIIMIGFFLRLYRLAAVPLRGDEAFSVLYWARQPLADALANTATIEPHPAFIYALFRGWGLLFGTSAFSMRLLPALTNLLGIPALYVLGKRLGGWQLGLLAAFLFALHPFEIWHAQDARNNAIWAGFSAVALAAGFNALSSNKRWWLYAVFAAIAANIFYLDLLTLAAFGLYVLLAHRQQFLRWLLAASPAVITAVASFLILQGRLIATGTYAGTTASKLDLPRLFSWFLPTLTFGETLPADFSVAIWPFIALALLLGLYLIYTRNRQSALFLGVLGFAPPILFCFAAIRLNIFTPRYLLLLIPIYTLLFSALIIGLTRLKILGKIAASALFIAWVGISGFSLYNYVAVPVYAKSRDWPLLTNYLSANVTDADLVIQLSVDPAFGFYYQAPADDIALPGYPTQPTAEIESILTTERDQRRSIWIVGQTFTDWPSAGVVENWLDTNMQAVRNGFADDLRYTQYLPWDVFGYEIVAQPLAIFGEKIDLVGTQYFLPPESSGDLTVWLYWRPQQTTDTPLKVFVHLVGEVNPATGSPLWSQDDRFPQNGRVSTVDWLPGMVYRDIFTVPLADVPSGTYRLEVGFYNPDTNERLTTDTADSYSIPSVIIP